ncbi:MAG: hypothetical protein ACPMAQ_15815 [Phycisphaerae bacterium]
MRNRRKAYIYGGILALAVLALLIDRAMYTAPQGVSAAEVPPSTPAKASAADAARPPAPDAPRRTAAPALPNAAARWLHDLPDVPEVRDLFAPSNLFPPRSEAPEAETDVKHKDPVAEFVASHRLSATFRDGRSTCAVVDGRVLRPGHQLDGFRLVSVDSFRATFVQGSLQAVLRLIAPEQAPDRHNAQDR